MSRSLLTRLLLLLVMATVGTGAFCADGGRVAVIYPGSSEPAYRAVFEAVLNGIKQKIPDDRLLIRAIDPDQPQSAEIKDWLAHQPPGSVITLGRKGLEDYQSSGATTPAISGAVDLSPSLNPKSSGISLSVDPKLLLGSLKTVLPGIKRVFVVYNAAKDQWLIDRAKDVAPQNQIEIVAIPVSDRAAATKAYWDLFKRVEPDRDALWLPLDSKLLDEKNVLPLILEQSWHKRFPVISNSLAHAKLGALFAIYPDSERLGQHLAEQALHLSERREPQIPAIEPLREVKRAVNKRFADHFGLDLEGPLRSHFDTVFKPQHGD